eukprot:COSAG02_NODE_18314_length_946_cov_1.028335_1_plen_56_part_10
MIECLVRQENGIQLPLLARRLQHSLLSEESIGEATAALAEHLGTQIQSRKLYEKQE